MPPSIGLSRETAAKLACVYSGVAWGLAWMPLRWLEEVGVEGPWIGVVFFAVQLCIVAPIVFVRSRSVAIGGLDLHITTFFAGMGMAFYALAVVYTDVIHAILLFYLTPIWSTLLARAVLKQRVTGLRIIAIVLGILGMLVIFRVDHEHATAPNLGDGFALLAGLMWSIAAVRLRIDTRNGAFELCYGFYLWCTIVCLLGALLPLGLTFRSPDAVALVSHFAWLVPVVLIIAFPGVLAAMWGPKFVDPGLVGILFMSEVVVGSITVAVWAGEPFGVREVLGVVLISLAALLESVFDYLKQDRGVAPLGRTPRYIADIDGDDRSA